MGKRNVLGLIALAPSLAVLVAVLLLRWSGPAAAGAACASALLIWAAGLFSAPGTGDITRAAADAGVLTALVIAMTLPGILFVEATRGLGSTEAIGRVVKAVGLSTPRTVVLIATGVGIVVESLTGMGVSLLMTMPLLLQIVPRAQAITLGLIGMSLMPWGALAISAHVAASLSGLPVELIAVWVGRTTGAVAFFLPLLCLAALRERSKREIAVAGVAGVALSGAANLATHLIGIELAGVAGGSAVIALMLWLSPRRDALGAALREPGLRPYFWLVAAVVAQKLSVAPLGRRGLSPVLSTGRVSFALVTSPGVALLAATAISARRSITGATLTTVLQRVLRPAASVALFMLAARLLVECGAIGALSKTIEGFGAAGSLIAVTLLGAVAGFATGSGATANALFMPSAQGVGQATGNVALLAALLNGAAGHVAITALPIAAILLAAIPDRNGGDDAEILRNAIVLAAWHVVVLLVAGLMQL